MSAPDDVIPSPLDEDDDDVAWALQTAAVQWRRGAKPDAVQSLSLKGGLART